MFDLELSSFKLLSWLALILAGGIHEFGHAYAAWKLGDDTAKDEGRLTVNPLAHIDLVGTVFVPLISPVVIGWMRPVPVDTRNLEQPDRDMAYISWAGPFTNFFQAFIATAVFFIWQAIDSPSLHAPLFTPEDGKLTADTVLISTCFMAYIQINILLGIFNLLPFPPLDGGGILQNFLSASGKMFLMRIAPYGIFIAIIVVIMGIISLFYDLVFGFIFSSPLIALPLGLGLLVFHFVYFRTKIVRDMRIGKDPVEKYRPGSTQDTDEKTSRKNVKLFTDMSRLVLDSGKQRAIKSLEPMQVADANICAPSEYNPDDGVCQRCEWFANCLKRKIEAEPEP